MSGSKTLIYDDSVLKIVCTQAEDEDAVVGVMRWLEAKLPVPKVIAYEKNANAQYLLMSKVPGKMACDAAYLAHPKELAALMAEALKMLWETDITDCPRERNIDAELAAAKRRVENKLADFNNTEPDTFGENGFESPLVLINWLEDHRPDYEPVLSHGDFCLPNVFLENGRVSGFIDLGETAVGDRWRDIALCWRSLRDNYNGSYGEKFILILTLTCFLKRLALSRTGIKSVIIFCWMNYISADARDRGRLRAKTNTKT